MHDQIENYFKLNPANSRNLELEEDTYFSVEDDEFFITDPTDETKKFRIDAGSITTATTRVLSVPDRDIILGGGDGQRISVYTTGGAYATPIVLTAAQSGRLIRGDTSAGLDFTLPAIATADIGVYFDFVVEVSVATNNYRFTAASGDLLFGGVWLGDFDTANTGAYFAPNGSSHLIMTMNGGTTGGKKGTALRFVATSATSWAVSGNLFGDGVIATPFS